MWVGHLAWHVEANQYRFTWARKFDKLSVTFSLCHYLMDTNVTIQHINIFESNLCTHHDRSSKFFSNRWIKVRTLKKGNMSTCEQGKWKNTTMIDNAPYIILKLSPYLLMSSIMHDINFSCNPTLSMPSFYFLWGAWSHMIATVTMHHDIICTESFDLSMQKIYPSNLHHSCFVYIV
mgnify:CR=1 FL=1